ncbi:MAG: hypothetical protein KC994_00365 [Candidatus Omnitrophica bacterium]|nr:hypothetical protein [Candidatus Omnitrophota bacterium]
MAQLEPSIKNPLSDWLVQSLASETIGSDANGRHGLSPQAGFDRNQTLRLQLNQAGIQPSLTRRDPCMAYILGDKKLIRPASVEGWIESSSNRFPLEEIREFWEGIWNYSVCAWNFIEAYGREPWQPPSMGFPLTSPRSWQGFSRNRRLFDSLDTHIESSGLAADGEFREWIAGQVEFLFGVPMDRVPLGMAAIGLNAPSESYWVPLPEKAFLAEPLNNPDMNAPTQDFHWGFRMNLELGSRLKEDEVGVWSVQIEDRSDLLETPTVAIVAEGEQVGCLYLRLKTPVRENVDWTALAASLDQSLGKGWGRLEFDSIRPAGSERIPRLESDWPWIGLARGIHQIREAERFFK